MKLGARPLEAMILVAQLACGKILKFDVILNVGRGQNHCPWTSEFEKATLENVESGAIKVVFRPNG